jgi:hypothetical protein
MGSFPPVIDSSILASFKQCPTLFRREYIEDWKAKEPSVHLHAGGAFAHGIEVARTAFYVEGMSATGAMLKGRQALADFYGDFECPASSAKSKDRMLGAYDFYWANYPLNSDSPPIILPSGRHGIEVNFAEPLPIINPDSGDPLIYCGRLDAILSFAGGSFITDEKTTSSLGPTWSRQWDLRSQFTGYAWGLGKIGIKVDGVLVRGISILKTKYETQQAISYRPEWQVDRWYDELLEWVGDMVRCYTTGKYRHNLDTSCTSYGGCQFREACSSQDPQPYLDVAFERRRWSPLTRVETKL